MNEHGNSAPRKPYAKPALTRVKLRPEEAVLGSCKTTGVSGPLQSGCNIPAPCAGSGS